jgi:predicted nucleic acid-binding protein
MQTFTLSHGLEIPDALIAATALELSLPLYTLNDRHFRMIPGLTVLRPY